MTISLACIKGSWSRHLEHAVEAQYFFFCMWQSIIILLIISRSDLLGSMRCVGGGGSCWQTNQGFPVLGSAFRIHGIESRTFEPKDSPAPPFGQLLFPRFFFFCPSPLILPFGVFLCFSPKNHHHHSCSRWNYFAYRLFYFFPNEIVRNDCVGVVDLKKKVEEDALSPH